MTDSKANGLRRRSRRFLQFQVFVGAIFVVFGAIFPIYVALKHGAGVHPIYDRFGAMIGSGNYLLLGIALGVFAVAMGVIAITMARRSLRTTERK